MKKLLLLILTLVTSLAWSQQDPMFTHYMYNTLWLNPAYAGTREAMTITGIHRSQWVGFDGAPVDQSLTIHTPILNGKMGLGLSLVNDKIGPTKNTMIAIDVAYHVQLTKKSKLSFGIKGLINMYSNSVSNLTINNPSDPSFAQNYNGTLGNAGAGVYYHHENFYVGLSTPELLQNKLDGSLTAASVAQRHYYLIAGAMIPLNKNLKFKPTGFLKATAGAPIEADLTASFVMYDKLSLGAMYRTGDGVGALLGYSFTDQITVGYSYDWSIANTTGKYNNGSHEIMLRYDLIYKSTRKIKSLRYF
jgi:type IX secretion system PorP/SprF family membrane protein